MTHFLNNNGSRWVNLLDNGNERDRISVKVKTSPWGDTYRQKAVKYWEAIGNFAVPYVRTYVNGKEFITQCRPSRTMEGCWEPNI